MIMKLNLILSFLILAIVFVGCSNEDETKIINVTGKAQKGPLLSGSVVTLSEIDEKLVQSGIIYTANITTDDGSFEMNNLQLKSNLALLTANGFYFNEVYGKLSPSQITLQAYVDLTDKEKVNVNILTLLTKQRIEKLIAEGKNIKVAKTQAENEFLSFMGQGMAIDKAFEDLDISNADEANAILLAFSVISQRYDLMYRQDALSTAELSELLTKIGNDFKDDGMINDQLIIDTLMHNIAQINLEDVRQNVENRYSTNENQAAIPNFEKYVTLFQKNHSKKIYSNFEYPEIATPFPYTGANAEIDNILFVSKNGSLGCMPYSLAAIVPFDKKLLIKIINKTGDIVMRGAPAFGWKESWDKDSKTFLYESQRYNMLISTLIYLEGSGTASIEYYENDFGSPVKVQNINW
jgi:hypothetical protein